MELQVSSLQIEIIKIKRKIKRSNALWLQHTSQHNFSSTKQCAAGEVHELHKLDKTTTKQKVWDDSKVYNNLN